MEFRYRQYSLDGKRHGFLFMCSKGYGEDYHSLFYMPGCCIGKDELVEAAEYMKKALALAKIALGYTSPNPVVGCVIVKDGEIVGTGYHHQAGAPHAEVLALQEAGDRATGATVYVTLEPCAHYGRTPPCARTLVQHKIKKVVIAMLDPNPLVAGKGAAILRQAGIVVEVGLLSAEAVKLNEVFIKNMLSNIPFIAIKLAQSLDGCIATRTGHSQWITNAWSRQYGQYLRSIYDGILVGINTILEDNPLLTCRVRREGQVVPHQPIRIVLDTYGRTPLSSQVVNDKTARTIIMTTAQCPQEKKEALLATGVTVLTAPTANTGCVDLHAALQLLRQEGIGSILVEGGSTIHGSFFDAKLVDKIYAFLGNSIIGGTCALCSVAGEGVDGLEECVPLHYDSIEIHDDNILIQAYNAAREGAYVHWNH